MASVGIAELVTNPWLLVGVELVGKALSQIKSGKAAAMSGLVTEILKASGDIGLKLVSNMINVIIYECTVRDYQLKSVIVNVYKEKVDALDNGNYRDKKLPNPVIKIMRSSRSLHKVVSNLNDKKFCFKPDRGSTDTMFIV